MPLDMDVPATMTSAQMTIHGVTTSPKNTTPYSTANMGIAKVTDRVRAGPARWISRKNSKYADPVHKTPSVSADSQAACDTGCSGQ